MPKLEICPLTLQEANYLIEKWHRHHKPVRAHRFSIGARCEGVLHGACIVARPIAPQTEQYEIAEISRLVTDGTYNACSKLYSAAARICKEMGFNRIQTFIQEKELGTSLLASGWILDGVKTGGNWLNREGRSFSENNTKQRWIKHLK